MTYRHRGEDDRPGRPATAPEKRRWAPATAAGRRTAKRCSPRWHRLRAGSPAVPGRGGPSAATGRPGVARTTTARNSTQPRQTRWNVSEPRPPHPPRRVGSGSVGRRAPRPPPVGAAEASASPGWPARPGRGRRRGPRAAAGSRASRRLAVFAPQHADHLAAPVERSPRHERPGRPVPQAADQHGQEDVAARCASGLGGCRPAGCTRSRGARTTGSCAIAARSPAGTRRV